MQCRGQGLARRLLHHSLDVAKQHDCDFSLLHSSKPHLQEYYHKLGWSNQAKVSFGIWRIPMSPSNEDDANEKFCVRGK